MENHRNGSGKKNFGHEKPLILNISGKEDLETPPELKEKNILPKFPSIENLPRIKTGIIKITTHPFIKRFQKKIVSAGNDLEEIEKLYNELRIAFEREDDPNLKLWKKIDGARILLTLIRYGSNGSLDWESLCIKFGATGRPEDTKTKKLHSLLEELRNLEIIELEHKVGAKSNDKKESFKITDKWLRMHDALGGPLLDDLAILNSEGIAVEPAWGRPQKDNKLVIFVLMPFEKKLRHVYKNHIKKVAGSLGFGDSIKRADESLTVGPVMSDVWNRIYSAKLIIADCTGRNSNVFYEIGIAHTIGKPIILITQNENDISFDVSHMRYIPYNENDMDSFENKLEDIIIETLDLKSK